MELLVIMSPERRSQEAIHFAVAQAAEQKMSLKAVYVIEESILKAVEKELAEIGFIGDKPGHEVSAALQKEHESRGQKVLDEISKESAKHNVSVTTEIVTGYYFRVCDELAASSAVGAVVVIDLKKGFFKKIFSTDEIKLLESSCHKPVYSYISEGN